MNSVKNQFKELLKLSQDHLRDCFSDQSHLFSTPSALHFFSSLKAESVKEPLKKPEIKQFFIPSTKETIKKSVEEKKSVEIPLSSKSFSPPLAPAPPAFQQNELTLEPFPFSSPLFEKKSYLLFLQKKQPQISFREFPPSDNIAKIKKEEWKTASISPKIIILLFPKDQPFQEFFKNLSQAISIVFHPAALIFSEEFERKIRREEMSITEKPLLILGNPSEILSHDFWRSFYKEETMEQKKFLKNIPLIPLLDSAIYLSQPSQKGVLWRNLVNALTL